MDLSADAHAADRLFETAFAACPTGTALVGLDGTWLRANPALCRLLGLSEAQLRLRTVQDVVDPVDADALLGQLNSGSGAPAETRFVAGGRVAFAQVSVSSVQDDLGRTRYLVLHAVDVSERRRMTEQLRMLATHDPVTGIWNRRRFEEELARQLARSLRHAESAVVLTVGLEDLRPIVDDLGAQAGDQVLSAVARILSRRLRGTDSVARVGDDAFAVLLSNTSLADGRGVAHELAALIAVTPIVAAQRQVTVRTSIGAAAVDSASKSVADILALADRDRAADLSLR